MSTAAFNADLWAWIFQSVETNTLWGVTLLRFARYTHIAPCIVRRQTLSDVWTIVHNDYADRAARLANQARTIQFWQTWEQHVAAVFAIEKICHQVMALHLAAGKRQVHSSVNETGEPAVVPMRQTREFIPQFRQGPWGGALPPRFSTLWARYRKKGDSMVLCSTYRTSGPWPYMDFIHSAL